MAERLSRGFEVEVAALPGLASGRPLPILRERPSPSPSGGFGGGLGEPRPLTREEMRRQVPSFGNLRCFRRGLDGPAVDVAATQVGPRVVLTVAHNLSARGTLDGPFAVEGLFRGVRCRCDGAPAPASGGLRPDLALCRLERPLSPGPEPCYVNLDPMIEAVHRTALLVGCGSLRTCPGEPLDAECRTREVGILAPGSVERPSIVLAGRLCAGDSGAPLLSPWDERRVLGVNSRNLRGASGPSFLATGTSALAGWIRRWTGGEAQGPVPASGWGGDREALELFGPARNPEAFEGPSPVSHPVEKCDLGNNR